LAVKIFIKRSVPADKAPKLLPLLQRLRTLAMHQPGYISGETLQGIDDTGEYIVISTWQSVENWQQWATSQTRNELQNQIDAVLNEKTEYEIYQH
jgi:antibiotic biosynthesis monooxygenase (ABM) superfamily enzyme